MIKLFTLAAAVSTIFVMASSASSAQDPIQDPIVTQRLKNIGQKFQRLPLELRTKYVKLKQKATEASRKQEYFTCMVAINDALDIFPDDMDLIWLKGICRAEIQDVDTAIVIYDEVLKIDPNHMPTLMNLVEINFFAGRYKKASEHIRYVTGLINSRGGAQVPLLDFKYLISMTKLARKDPNTYASEIKKFQSLHSYMEDNPYYYYANAVREIEAGNKEEGLIWILKAYLIFDSPPLIKTWNKALVDTDMIDAHEIMFKQPDTELDRRRR